MHFKMGTCRPILFRARNACSAIFVVALLGGWFSSEAFGRAMYTYVNEDGAVVLTDDLNNVPQRYRKGVQVTEVKEEQGGSATDMVPEVLSRARGTVEGWTLPIPDTIMPGFTNHQAIVLIGGFVIGAFVFAVMTLSRSPAMKFAMKWALMFVVVGMIYALYFSELDGAGSDRQQEATDPSPRPAGALQRVKMKAKSLEQIHEQKAEELDQVGGP